MELELPSVLFSDILQQNPSPVFRFWPLFDSQLVFQVCQKVDGTLGFYAVLKKK